MLENTCNKIMCKYSQFVKLIPVGGYVIFTIQKKTDAPHDGTN